MSRSPAVRTMRWMVLVLVASLLGLFVPGGHASAATVNVMVSTSASRTNATALAGTTRSGKLYIFTTPTAGITQVSFWLDDPQRSGLPKQVEAYSPFDFRGGTSAAAIAWDTTTVSNGAHSITVQVVDNAKVTTVLTAPFTISNGTAAGYAPQVSTSNTRSAPFPLAGGVVHGNVYVFVPSVVGITKVSFYLDDPARAHAPKHIETAAPWDLFSSGPTTATALPWATTTVSNGTHVLSVDVAAGAATTRIDTTFTVMNTVATTTPTPTPTMTTPPTTAPPTTAPPTTAPPTTPPPTTTAPPTTVPPTTVPPNTPAPSAPAASAPAPSGPAPSAAPSASAVVPTTIPPTTAVPTTAPPTTAAPTTSAPSPLGPFVSTYTWKSIAPLPIGTLEAQSAVLNGKLYFFGGFDIQVPRLDPTSRAWSYDPSTAVWSSLPPMPDHGITHAGLANDGQRYLYYAGGFAFDPTLQARLLGTNLVWRYDTQTGAYTPMPSLPQPRAMGGLVYISGTLYYFGGSQNYMGTPDSSSVWSLDVAGNATAWVARAPMPNPRNHAGYGVIDGQIYVVGGQHQYTSYIAQNELDRYNPASNTWVTLAPMPNARGHLLDSTTVVEGRLVVGGGWTTSNATAELADYNPASNRWSEMTPLPLTRTGTALHALSGDRLINATGNGGGSTSAAWIGTPAP